MKKLFLALCILSIICLPIFAEMVEITAGQGEPTDNLNPHHDGFDYAYSQFIYLQSQISTPLVIDKIALYWNGLSEGSLCNNWEIYLAHTTLSQFGSYTSASSWVDSSTMTLVYTGFLTLPLTAGWVEIPLATTFTYNNTQNLVIAVNEITPGHPTGDAGFFVGALSPMRGIRVQRNDTPFSIPTVTQSPASQNIGGYPHLRLYQEARLPVTNLTAQVTGNSVVLNWQAPAGAAVQGYKVFRNTTLLTMTPITTTSYTNESVPVGSYTYSVNSVYSSGESAPTGTSAIVYPETATIEITAGGTDNLNPHHTDYDFAYSQFIFLQSQINSPLIINQIALYWNGGSNGALNNHWEIYLTHTALTQFGTYSSPSSWIDSSTMTQVYSGYLNLPLTAGWVDIALQVPFVYNNTANLAIAVNEITPGHTENDQGWFVGSLSPMRGIRVQRDVTPFIVPNVTASPASQNIGGYPHIRLYHNAILMPPPGNLTAEVNENTVELHWINPTGFPEQAFKVYRNQVLLTSGLEDDNYTDTNVPNGTHTYTVTASYPPHGDSVPATVQVVVDYTPPTPPVTNLTAEVTGNTVALQWVHPAPWSNAQFKVFRNNVLLTNTAIIDVSYTDENVADGTYTYAVTALYTWGESEPTTVQAVVNTTPPEMPPVTNLTALVTAAGGTSFGSVELNWDASTAIPEQLYNVYCDDELLTTESIMGTTYTDELVPAGTHTYAVTAVYPPWGESEPATIEVFVESSDADIVEPLQTTKLFANYPNPFNPTTTIKFALTRTDNVKIDIFSVNGQLVRSLVSGLYGIGEHNIVWNGLDNSGHQVSSGVYFYRLSTSDFVASRKMLLLK